MTVTRVLRICTAASLLGLASCGGGSNALIGTWVLVEGTTCPIDKTIFTPTTNTIHVIAIGPNPPSTSTNVITYLPGEPNQVIVQGQGTGAGAETYIFNDADHMKQGDNDTCIYQRAK
jgi:hypothetical protein